MPVVLRDYQQDWIERLRMSMRAHRRVLGVAPTGSGKTVCFAYVAEAAARRGKRVLILAHRALILDQIGLALAANDCEFGRIQPSWPEALRWSVQIGMIQTVARRLDRIPAPDLIVVDEAHHAVSDTYRAVPAHWPDARVLGVTATPQRLDGRGLEDDFDDLVPGAEVADLIGRGFLARYRYLVPAQSLDMSSARVTAGDYTAASHDAIVDRATVTGDAEAHYRRYLDGAPAIAFCRSIAHAEHVASAFRDRGWQAASIDGRQTDSERSRLIADLANGRLNVLTSCDLIGEGVDVPVVAGAILLRRTRSLALFLQHCGRALRPKPGGGEAVILDHVGNATEEGHGLPDQPRAWMLRGRVKGDPVRVRQCKQCYRLFGGEDTVECDIRAGECLALPRPAEASEPARPLPETVAGELVTLARTPEWAGGADIVLAKGDEWRALVARADTREKLSEIARARGFKAQWVAHVLARRRGVSPRWMARRG